MPDNADYSKPQIKSGKTVYKSLASGGLLGGGAPCAVDVRNGRIVRVRPMRCDLKYTRERMNPWKYKSNGRTLEPGAKSLYLPFSLACKKRAYSPNRIKYPLVCIDLDPNGERNSQKTIHAPHGCQTMLLDGSGGYTQKLRNPDSWEGWHSNDGQWRVHAQCDYIPCTREVANYKLDGPCVYKYGPLWVNPSGAAKQGVVTGDIIRVYNMGVRFRMGLLSGRELCRA